MISSNILKEANRLVESDRHKSYGDKLENHENIAALWSTFLRKEISSHDVAVCMILVKIARLMHAKKMDNYIDMAAYAAIAGEIFERKK